MKGRILLSVFILVCGGQSAMAQDVLGNITLNSGSPGEFGRVFWATQYLFVIGTCRTDHSCHSVFFTSLMGKTESWNPLPLNFRPDGLLTIHSSVDSLYFYYIERPGKKDARLHAMIRDKKSGRTEFSFGDRLQCQPTLPVFM